MSESLTSYPGKIWESDIIWVRVHDPRQKDDPGLIKDMTIAVPAKIDYVDFKPEYLTGESWWYYDVNDKITHVMIEDTVRIRYESLYEKEKSGIELTQEEISEMDTYRLFHSIYPRVAIDKAVADEKYTKYIIEEIDARLSEKKRTLRTKAKATDAVSSIPEKLAIITNKNYSNGLNLSPTGEAYLQPLASTDGLRFEDGVLYFQNVTASEATLKEINAGKDVTLDSIDLPLLRLFYSIILADFQKSMKSKVVNEVVTIYLPDLAVMLGKKRNIGKNDIKAIIDKTASFQSIYGVIKDPDRPNGIGSAEPLLVWLGYKEETNTIKFSSPYMLRLIQKLYDVSIKKSEIGVPILKPNGEPDMLPMHTYLIKPTIVKERNKRAVEIVTTVLYTIENAGKRKTPHIKVRTILERVPQLQEALEKNCPSNRNRVLKSAFSKAWELLRTQTTVMEKYPNMQLPDPKDPAYIPTMSTLDMVIEFPRKNSTEKVKKVRRT